MPVDVKARITYNRDSDTEYTMDCKQLGISEDATGSIEYDIESMRDLVTKAISKEFHVEPASITITSYTHSMNFSIEGPVNHTLDKFTKDKRSSDPEENDNE